MKIFIDGAEGTTGLQLEERLSAIKNIEILKIDNDLRKDINERRRLLNAADTAFLCLPDTAARESVSLVDNPNTVIIDASTAHRTAPGWAYGFPELSDEHRNTVKTSNRISVPGCHASGFAALVYPLVGAGVISKDETLVCTSLTGYSGGGKPLIAEYEGGNPPRGATPYALGLTHKHLPEMKAVCGLSNPPIFMPILADIYNGMLVSIPLARNARELWEILDKHYKNADNIAVKPLNAETKLSMETLNGTDKMEIFISGHDTQTVLTARFDNLGKGASGAAVQCFRLRMGL